MLSSTDEASAQSQYSYSTRDNNRHHANSQYPDHIVSSPFYPTTSATENASSYHPNTNLLPQSQYQQQSLIQTVTNSIPSPPPKYFYQPLGVFKIWKDCRFATTVMTLITTLFYIACNLIVFDPLSHPDRARRVLQAHSFIKLFFFISMINLIKLSTSLIRFPSHYLYFNPSVIKLYHPSTFSALSNHSNLISNGITNDTMNNPIISVSTHDELPIDGTVTTLQLQNYNRTRHFPLQNRVLNLVSPILYLFMTIFTSILFIWYWSSAWTNGRQYYRDTGGNGRNGIGTYFIIGGMLSIFTIIAHAFCLYMFHQRLRFYNLVWGTNEYRVLFANTGILPKMTNDGHFIDSETEILTASNILSQGDDIGSSNYLANVYGGTDEGPIRQASDLSENSLDRTLFHPVTQISTTTSSNPNHDQKKFELSSLDENEWDKDHFSFSRSKVEQQPPLYQNL